MAPKNEPDGSDPLSLHAQGFPDPSGESLRAVAACLAAEMLGLGHTPERILAMFRSPSYALPHRAWKVLGDDAVQELLERLCRQAPSTHVTAREL